MATLLLSAHVCFCQQLKKYFCHTFKHKIVLQVAVILHKISILIYSLLWISNKKPWGIKYSVIWFLFIRSFGFGLMCWLSSKICRSFRAFCTSLWCGVKELLDSQPQLHNTVGAFISKALDIQMTESVFLLDMYL